MPDPGEAVGGGGGGACPEPVASSFQVSHSSSDLYAPQTYSITAGGPISVSDCFEGGSGYLASAADLTLYYSADKKYSLSLKVDGSCDTMLVVNDPIGDWYYNDDTDGLDPEIYIPNASDGRYDVWLGTIGSSPCSASLKLETF